MSTLTTFFAALLFGLGLGVSGMLDPEKVIGFLDVFGSWQPALILVMAGAISVHFVSYLLAGKRSAPILEEDFKLPVNFKVDRHLFVGSAIFGAGWGISGLCPGPVISSLLFLDYKIAIFFCSMVAGMSLHAVAFRAEVKGKEH